MQPTVEVCILAFGSEAVIGAAVKSASAIPAVSIAVLDHGARPTSVAAALAAADRAGLRIRTDADGSNPGFAAGCNRIARGSQADWLVFLNPDAIITAWPWGPEGPETGHLIGAAQHLPNGDSIDAFGERFGVLEEIRRSWFRRPARRPHGVGFVGGGACAIERQRFLALGGFDESYFMFYEDIDLGMRAGVAKLPVVVEDRWRVTHAVGHAARRDIGQAVIDSYSSGRRFHAAYGHRVVVYDVFVAMDSVLRALYWSGRRRPGSARAYVRLAAEALRNAVARPSLVETRRRAAGSNR